MLVAEDSSTDLELLTHALSDITIPVLLKSVPDGLELLRYMNGEGQFADRWNYHLPDLIVLDLKMPVMNGLEALASLKANPHYAQVPVVVLSGSNVEKDIQKAYELGANTYFTKPLGFLALQQLMHHVVGYWSRSQHPSPAPRMSETKTATARTRPRRAD